MRECVRKYLLSVYTRQYCSFLFFYLLRGNPQIFMSPSPWLSSPQPGVHFPLCLLTPSYTDPKIVCSNHSHPSVLVVLRSHTVWSFCPHAAHPSAATPRKPPVALQPQIGLVEGLSSLSWPRLLHLKTFQSCKAWRISVFSPCYLDNSWFLKRV